MNDHESRMKLFSLNIKIASLKFEYYELLTANRSLAMKLFGYRSTNPEKFPKELVKKMEFYVFAGRTDD